MIIIIMIIIFYHQDLHHHHHYQHLQKTFFFNLFHHNKKLLNKIFWINTKNTACATSTGAAARWLFFNKHKSWWKCHKKKTEKVIENIDNALNEVHELPEIELADSLINFLSTNADEILQDGYINDNVLNQKTIEEIKD